MDWQRNFTCRELLELEYTYIRVVVVCNPCLAFRLQWMLTNLAAVLLVTFAYRGLRWKRDGCLVWE